MKLVNIIMIGFACMLQYINAIKKVDFSLISISFMQITNQPRLFL